MLALLVWRFISKRPPVLLAVVLSLGLTQELTQVVAVRGFGWPECKDLLVDGLATLVALAIVRPKPPKD